MPSRDDVKVSTIDTLTGPTQYSGKGDDAACCKLGEEWKPERRLSAPQYFAHQQADRF